MAFELQKDSLFANRYRIIRCIASGAMGAVYEVLHTETERRCALKVMLPHILQSEPMRERFKREAKVAAQVDSEHIVTVFDAGYDRATSMPFLVMELLRGEDLEDRISRGGPLQVSNALPLLYQLALALDATHCASVIHRDLKPRNLFLVERTGGSRQLKVLDFGIAKMIAESTASAGTTQNVLGTPLYMAPEQFNPNMSLSASCDIYAFGMIAYTMLVGTPYWGEEATRSQNIVAFVMTVVQGTQEPASVRAKRAGVVLPETFDAWFARVTAAHREFRFPSAMAAMTALAEAVGTSLSSSESSLPAAVSLPKPQSITETGMDESGMTEAARMRSTGLTSVSPSRQHKGPAIRPIVVAALLALCSFVISAAIVLRRASHEPGEAADAPSTPPDSEPLTVTPATAQPPKSADDLPLAVAAPSDIVSPTGSLEATPSPRAQHVAPPKPAGANAREIAGTDAGAPQKRTRPAATQPPKKPLYSQD